MNQVSGKRSDRAKRVTVNNLVGETLIGEPARCGLEVLDLRLTRNHLVIGASMPRVIELECRVPGFAIGACELIVVSTRVFICKKRMRKQDSGVP